MIKLLAVVLALSIGLNVFSWFQFTKKEEKVTQKAPENYPYLARRIFLEKPNDVIINFNELRSKLRELVSGQDSKIGLYFEYLPTGIHIGINDREGFRRASLIKLPTVMRVYRLNKEGKLKKSDELTIEKDQLDSDYGKLWKRGEGTKITIEEAVKFALVESDNTAFNVLRDKIAQIDGRELGNNNGILTVYDYLDIPRDIETDNLNISARNFSSILKSLFFSAYLDYEDSNEILEIMATPTTLFNMLDSGVPESIKVADKFAVNKEGEKGSLVTSDCGIVFVPQRPYVICVMINDQPETAANKISEISKIVYDYVSNANGY